MQDISSQVLVPEGSPEGSPEGRPEGSPEALFIYDSLFIILATVCGMVWRLRMPAHGANMHVPRV
jgi:hypothetical protein